MGGLLSEEGVISKYYACQVTDDDLEIYGIERGSCKGQQVLEALAILVAMRLWHQPGSTKRTQCSVRGDNVGALTLVVKMRPASAQQAIVARELALLTAQSAFPPSVTHTPGVAHVLADLLSRMHDSSKDTTKVLEHPALAGASRSHCPPRPRSWYRALSEATPLRSAEIVG